MFWLTHQSNSFYFFPKQFFISGVLCYELPLFPVSQGQLADLHRVEVEKNLEAEKQVKFFQGCVAAPFAERDHSILECEKAKEKEELMSQKFNEMQKRLEMLSSDFIEQRKINDTLENDLIKHEEQVGSFKKIDRIHVDINMEGTEVACSFCCCSCW